MKWNDFIRIERTENLTEPRELTDIECPVCGRHIYRRTDVVLTSMPPKYMYECNCGWHGCG